MTFIIVDVRLCYVVLFPPVSALSALPKTEDQKPAGPEGVSPSCLKVCADQPFSAASLTGLWICIHHPKEIHHDAIK